MGILPFWYKEWEENTWREGRQGTRPEARDKRNLIKLSAFLFPKVAKRGFCYFFCDTKLKTGRKLCCLHKISLQTNKLKFILVFYFRPILAFYGEYTNLVFLQEYLIMECLCLKIILYKIECLKIFAAQCLKGEFFRRRHFPVNLIWRDAEILRHQANTL